MYTRDYMKRPEWTGEIVKRMHIYNITRGELAKRVGIHPQYVISVLTGKVIPALTMRSRMRDAIDAIVKEREQNGND